MQRVARGGSITLDANFRLNGVLTDADPIFIDVSDPNDVQDVSDAAPTAHLTTGRYRYVYDVELSAALGIWRIDWEGTLASAPAHAAEVFEVIAAPVAEVPADTLATIDELAAHLKVEIDDDDESALQALQKVTAAIQDEACHRIFYVADDVRHLVGNWGGDLWLPEPPVTAVSEVTLKGPGGSTWSITDTTFTRRGLLRRRGGFINASDPDYLDVGVMSWGGPAAEVTVKYSHGYVDIPEELRRICVEAAGRGYQSPAGSVQEEVGSYELTQDERRVCRRYRQVIPG